MQHGAELCWGLKTCYIFRPVGWVCGSYSSSDLVHCWPEESGSSRDILLGVISYAKGCAKTRLRVLFWKRTLLELRSSDFRLNLCVFPLIFFLYLSLHHSVHLFSRWHFLWQNVVPRLRLPNTFMMRPNISKQPSSTSTACFLRSPPPL